MTLQFTNPKKKSFFEKQNNCHSLQEMSGQQIRHEIKHFEAQTVGLKHDSGHM